MKKYFTIREISRLFNIGLDSLRYYEEIGLIVPKRGSNNYRLYSMNEMYRLNIISDLRKLHFSLPQIKEYLDDQSLNNTCSLLDKEKLAIKDEIARLKKQLSLIETQEKLIADYREKETNTFSIQYFPARYALQLEREIVLDEEFDFAIRCLFKEYGFKLHQFDNHMLGASMSVTDWDKGTSGKFHSAFILQDKKSKNMKELLPEGNYLCFCYKGSYRKLPLYIRQFLDYAKENNLKMDDMFYELYLIDNRYTLITEEYLTEIQVRLLTPL